MEERWLSSPPRPRMLSACPAGGQAGNGQPNPAGGHRGAGRGTREGQIRLQMKLGIFKPVGNPHLRTGWSHLQVCVWELTGARRRPVSGQRALREPTVGRR